MAQVAHEPDPDSWPPQFSLDQERILNLLTGDRFYSNSSAALREAVLNAIDAVYRRRLTERHLDPQIAVTFNRENLALSISDNGDGMDRTAMSRLFTRIGASAAQLETNRGSVGEFGIGVVSYFMAGDSFSVQTFDGVSEPIGLKFKRDMLAGGAAITLEPTRQARGTTVQIFARDRDTFELLLESFPEWCRDVVGLTGAVQPDNVELDQGGSHRPDAIPDLSIPNWVERAHLAPISGVHGWDAMSGTSKISVLYRGVFVQDFEVRSLWGIEGSIDVDPKHFKPRLNREGFVGTTFQSEVEQFLRQSHPKILEAMAIPLTEAIKGGVLDRWSERRWATLWLSVPRDSAYSNAATAWDRIFRQIPAFELAVRDKWEPLSLDGLLKLGGPIFVAPHPEEQQTEVTQAAVRLLRHTGRNVIRGLRRDSNWLREATNSFGTTADLIASAFAGELPTLSHIAPQAESLLAEVKALASLYGGDSPVDLVRIGTESQPVLRLQARLLINIENPKGKAIVEDAIAANAGRWSLIAITARHSYEHISQVAAAIREYTAEREVLGLIKRRLIRRLVS